MRLQKRMTRNIRTIAMSSQRNCVMSSAGFRRAISTTPTLASSMTSGKRHVSMYRRTRTPCRMTAATMTEPRQVRDAQEVLRVDDARLRMRLEVEHSESGNQDAERR